ncbi:peptide/nickel transport system substrate-binding protein [Blastococcus aurantiacus]|uniref:Peptide/nickel transport system substrate-binding protein n=1 Tax=Blastococcus aurantiacus TaxID=1550231 RepID=A0A1G7MND7_9ACTN|nr:ABC transporter substrate-binding protein [Blastococcus aurantiacus]SDF63184.1 peptide/nickel transport system substrate-binding protein [Blastococcus aurantiacus]
MTRRSTTRLLAASAAALTAVSLSACASSDREDEGGGGGGETGGTLVFGAAGDPKMFDPAFASDGETFRVARQIHEGLLGNELGGTDPVPELARDWDVSEDGLEYTFALEEGVKFHDGTDFNAEAVCFNFDRWYNFEGLAQSPSATPYYQDVFGGFASTPDTPSIFESCEATDESTAVIRLTKVTSRFPSALALPAFSIQSPDALQEYDADNLGGNDDALTYSEYALEHPVGTGPFKFDSWDRSNGEVTIVRNDDYWGDKAKLDEIIFRTISDGNTRRQEFQAGEIDAYDFVAPADYETLQEDGEVLVRDPFNILYLGINHGNVPGTTANPALKDVRVRQAIAHAIDRETIVNSQLPEGAEVATQFMPPTVEGWADDVTTYEYDVERAKELLAEAGATGTTLKFFYPTDVSRPYLPDPAAIFQVINQNLIDAGFTVEATALPWNPDYLNAVQAGLQHDIHLLGWTGDYNDAYNFIGTFFAAKADGLAKAEFGAFDNQEIFAALDEGDTNPDVDGRTEDYQEANRRIMEFLPGLPISHSPPALVVSERVQGLEPSPLTAEVFSTVSLTD